MPSGLESGDRMASSRGPTQLRSWTHGVVEAERERVQRELRDIQRQQGVLTAVKVAEGQVAALESDHSSAGLLRRWHFLFEALRSQRDQGTLGMKEARRALAVAHAILRAQSVGKAGSRLGYLRGQLIELEAHLVAKEGDHWGSFWLLKDALTLSWGAPPATICEWMLALAASYQRQGMADQCLRTIADALRQVGGTPPAPLAHRATLLMAQTLRLAGRWTEAEATLKDAGKTLGASPEFDWERGCLSLAGTGDPKVLLHLAKTALREATRPLLQLTLWVKAIPSRQFVEQPVLVRTLARKRALRPQQAGPLYRIALAFENAHDPDLPAPRRMEGIGAALAEARRLISLEDELLAWGAATRHFARHGAVEAAVYAAGIYGSMSREVTTGRELDALGILGDVVARPWFPLRR